MDCDLPDPTERWLPWDLLIPPGATAVRLVAQGGKDGAPPWLGFSEPFTPAPSIAFAAYQALQILTTFALGLILILLPGVVGQRFVCTPEFKAAVLIGAGPLLMALIAILAAIAGAWIPAVTFGAAGAGLVWALAGGWLLWRPTDFELSESTCRVMAVAVLCALAAVAKAAYSGGPEGELFRGDARRTLAVGNRSDCETSYCTVQVVEHHLSPFSAEAMSYFAPWSFFSRGPLAGLAATPLVFATGKPPSGHLAASWQPFDPWGYTSYRIAMAILATSSIVALFFVLAGFVDEWAALIGASAIALCPLVMHETFFTWPKLAATAWVSLSFLLAHRRRPVLGGVALSLGYLFHPMALLWTPWIGLWTMRGPVKTWTARVAAGAQFGIPLAIVVGPWMAASAIARSVSGSVHAAQSIFLEYFAWAEGYPATLSSWMHSRWSDFANTFLPFWLHFFNEGHADLNSVYGIAGPLVKFAFSWWNTLPLGMGLVLWSLCAIALVRSWRERRAAVFLLLIGPALLLCAYWGDKSTGLMRECGHPLVPARIAIALVHYERVPRTALLARFFFHWIFPWIQLPGVLLMLWLTTLANPDPPRSDLKSLDPVWFAVNVAALLAIAYLASSFRRERIARPQP